MNISLAQRPEVRPSDRQEIVSVQASIVFNDESCVALKYLKKNDHVRLADVLSSLINNKLFVPLAVVVARDAHVMERGAHRQDEVYFVPVVDVSF